MSLRATLTTFTVSTLVAALLIGATSLWGQHKGNQMATHTFAAKDVTADVLPPPLYLIEMRLVLSQAAEGTLPLDRAYAELNRLRTEYETRVRHWEAHPPFGLEGKVLGAQHLAAQDFINVARRTLDAVAGGDAHAIHTLLRQADAAYLVHRAGVDITVREASHFVEASVNDYEKTMRTVRWTQGVVLVLTLLGLAGLGWWLRKMVWSAVGGEPAVAAAVARAVAQGDLSVQVPVQPGDRHSIMAAMREMFEHASTRDALTGALNRNGFERALDTVFSGQPLTRPAAVVMIDLDDFKPINDTAGHAAGDAMLSTVARTISSLARSTDVVARIGGDEFAVLLPNCDQAQAFAVAENMRQAIAQIELNWEGAVLRLSASMGVAELTESHESVAQWLAQADDYCYEAKHAGRNRVRGLAAARTPRSGT